MCVVLFQKDSCLVLRRPKWFRNFWSLFTALRLEMSFGISYQLLKQHIPGRARSCLFLHLLLLKHIDFTAALAATGSTNEKDTNPLLGMIQLLYLNLFTCLLVVQCHWESRRIATVDSSQCNPAWDHLPCADLCICWKSGLWYDHCQFVSGYNYSHIPLRYKIMHTWF